jgi:hypothetical protein
MARPRVVRPFITDYRDFTIEHWIKRCRALVAASNQGQTDDLVDHTIEGIAAGKIYGIYGFEMPRETQTTLNNLGAFVRAGVCSLRRCRVCRQWFLSFTMRHALRVLCEQPACHKADARARAQTSRRIETQKRRNASRQVVRPRTR